MKTEPAGDLNELDLSALTTRPSRYHVIGSVSINFSGVNKVASKTNSSTHDREVLRSIPVSLN